MRDHRYVSRYFQRWEFTESTTAARHGWPNVPSVRQWQHLERLAGGVLDPLREEFGPIVISSGYRCPELNAQVGGASKSAHLDGRAADFTPRRRDVALFEIMDWLAAHRDEVPFDKAILEYDRWIHIQVRGGGRAPRGLLLQKYSGTPYEPYRV